MSNQRADFAEFYRQSRNDCLRAVLVNVGDQDTAQDLVAEAFARAWASWRTVSRHPAPAAWVVRTALNAGVSRWRRRRREIPLPDPGTLTGLPAAGLQRTLRADGVRATVTFDDQQNPVCRNYSKPSATLTNSVIGMPLGYHEPTLVIHPSALPADAGVQIAAGRLEHPKQGGIAIGLEFGLVQASPECTGS